MRENNHKTGKIRIFAILTLALILSACQDYSTDTEIIEAVDMECSKVKQLMVKGAVERLLGEAAAGTIQDFRCAKEYGVSYTTGAAILAQFEGAGDLNFQDFGSQATTTAPVDIFGPVLPEIFTPDGQPTEALEYFDIFEKDSSSNMTVLRSKARPNVLYAMYYQGY